MLLTTEVLAPEDRVENLEVSLLSRAWRRALTSDLVIPEVMTLSVIFSMILSVVGLLIICVGGVACVVGSVEKDGEEGLLCVVSGEIGVLLTSTRV